MYARKEWGVKPFIDIFKKVLIAALMLSATTFIGVIIYWTVLSVMNLWLVHPSVVLFTGSMILAGVAGAALVLTEILE